MKAPLFLPVALICLSFGPVLSADSGGEGRVEVNFSHPENFTDVKDSSSPTSEGRDGILESLRRHIVAEASRYVPATEMLRITFTDIDLAGDFEPWRGPQFDGVRIVKPIYAPAFKFSYTVTNARGMVVRQGSESIRDLNFQDGVLPGTDPLRFEKAILTAWIGDNLKALK